MILIVVKHPVRPAYADEWPTVVEEFTAAAGAEPGNACFDWYRRVPMTPTSGWWSRRSVMRKRAGRTSSRTTSTPRSPGWLPQLLTDVPEVINVEVPGAGCSRVSELKVERAGP